LFHAASLRQEIAKEIPALAAIGAGDLGEHGVLLSSAKTEVGSSPVVMA
jgi:hypothetical protein